MTSNGYLRLDSRSPQSANIQLEFDRLILKFHFQRWTLLHWKSSSFDVGF